MFKSTRASIAVGGMAAVKKGIDAKLFEEILDKSVGQNNNTIEEVSKEETEEESLRDKLQDEHMKEIEKKKESEENYFCSHSKRQDSMLSTVEGEC